MDYSKLSDAEINELVARMTGVHFDEEGPCYFDYSGIDSPYSDGEPLRVSFDPCNNPADAWPIIVDKKICLAFDVFAEPHDGGAWVAAPAYGWEKERVRHENPLRAAMIVFLMMQEKSC